jgi:hypothetical protein
MSDFRYEIKTSLPVIWLENIDTKNPGWSVRKEQNNDQLILVDPVNDDEAPCPRTRVSSTDWQCDLRKRKN